ncbi:hypothetical protein, partial [Vibrio alfacsensis]|uniref:hypothetical protein n=1 Tax=Vibrio alfacsensis TaxID=1074311 RepID=UPI0040686A17
SHQVLIIQGEPISSSFLNLVFMFCSISSDRVGALLSVQVKAVIPASPRETRNLRKYASKLMTNLNHMEIV